MSYCDILNIVKLHYMDFCPPNADIQAVVVGGSVARGYANKGCDVDVIYFDKNTSYYKKRFACWENNKIELHYVPISIFPLLYSYVEPILVSKTPIALGQVDYSAWGEKKCPHKNSNRQYHMLLSAWRELKKLLDGVIIYDNNNWYSELQSCFKMSPDVSKVKIIVDHALKCNQSNIANLIDIMKFHMLTRQEVFSKVYWTDYYLEHQLMSIKDLVMQAFSPLPCKSQIEDWLKTTESRYQQLNVAHQAVSCEICDGEIRKCNIGRCANDFIDDSKRAYQNGLILGSLLSIMRANEYINQLADMDNVSLSSLDDNYDEMWMTWSNNIFGCLDKILVLLFGG